ncbi:MAG: CopG family transcriptional regulator [Candidatus Thiosymbion ectosymbiont of Robbea hypermnestra]|nr:CopG family transcriptional regulator [Candidatus Thiosymbion ectosymbiont of Robbea hypermnestra]
MGQVTIYLEEGIERKMVAAAKSARLSKSKWIAGLIRERISNEWPSSIVELAGTWKDFPDADVIRSHRGQDADREKL